MDVVDFDWFEHEVARMEKLRSPQGITEREAMAAIEHELRFLTSAAESKRTLKLAVHAGKNSQPKQKPRLARTNVGNAWQISEVDNEIRQELSLTIN